MEPVRILLVNDHMFIRSCIRRMLDASEAVNVLADTGDGQEVLRLVAEARPNLVLTELFVLGLNVLEITSRVTQQWPETYVAILTGDVEGSYVLEALRAGATGFVDKGETTERVWQAVHQIARGNIYLSPSVLRILVDNLRRTERPSGSRLGLTVRESEVYNLLNEGHSVKEIAYHLCVSDKTIYAHRAHIMRALRHIRGASGLTRLLHRDRESPAILRGSVGSLVPWHQETVYLG